MSSPMPNQWGDIDKIFAGSPTDLMTIGGLWVGPFGVELPEDVDEPLDDDLKNFGYISDKGVDVQINDKTKPLNAWGGDEIGQFRDVFGVAYGVELFQVLSPEVNAGIFGVGNVSTAAATAQHGARMKLLLNSKLPPKCSLVLDAYYEEKAIRQVASCCQRGDIGKLTIVHNAPMTYMPTFKALRGRDGNHVIQYSDDGVKAA